MQLKSESPPLARSTRTLPRFLPWQCQQKVDPKYSKGANSYNLPTLSMRPAQSSIVYPISASYLDQSISSIVFPIFSSYFVILPTNTARRACYFDDRLFSTWPELAYNQKFVEFLMIKKGGDTSMFGNHIKFTSHLGLNLFLCL